MNILVQAILPFILLYKYWAIFSLTFLASLAIPIPAGTLLVASAAFASQGYFNILTLITIVTLANLAGDNLSYWLARIYGVKILSHVKFIERIINSNNFNLVKKSIKNNTGPFIFISRFEVISTLSVNFISGLGKVSYKKFLAFEVTGTIANVLFYTTLGYLFGDSWQAVNEIIGNFTLLFFLVIILGLSLFWKRIINKLSREN